MKPQKLAPYLAFLICHSLHAQILNKPFGTQNKLLGDISSVYAANFSSLNNPAFLGSNPNMQLALHHEIPYFQKSLATSGLSVQAEIKKFGYGFSLIQSGSEHFKQHVISQGLSKKISDKFWVGVSINYLITSMYSQNKLHNFYGSVGLKMQLNPKILMGCHVVNPSASKYKLEQLQPIGQFLQLGIAYKFTEQISFLSEYKTQTKSEGNLSFACLYQIKNEIDFRFGFDKELSFFTSGIRINRKNMHWVIGAQLNRILGTSASAEWSYIRL